MRSVLWVQPIWCAFLCSRSLGCYGYYALSSLWCLPYLKRLTSTLRTLRETSVLLRSYSGGMVYYKKVKNVGIGNATVVKPCSAHSQVSEDGAASTFFRRVSHVCDHLRRHSGKLANAGVETAAPHWRTLYFCYGTCLRRLPIFLIIIAFFIWSIRRRGRDKKIKRQFHKGSCPLHNARRHNMLVS